MNSGSRLLKLLDRLEEVAKIDSSRRIARTEMKDGVRKVVTVESGELPLYKAIIQALELKDKNEDNVILYMQEVRSQIDLIFAFMQREAKNISKDMYADNLNRLRDAFSILNYKGDYRTLLRGSLKSIQLVLHLAEAKLPKEIAIECEEVNELVQNIVDLKKEILNSDLPEFAISYIVQLLNLVQISLEKAVLAGGSSIVDATKYLKGHLDLTVSNFSQQCKGEELSESSKKIFVSTQNILQKFALLAEKVEPTVSVITNGMQIAGKILP